MKKLFIVTLLTLSSVSALFAQQTAPDAAELTRLLNEFLTGAGHNDALIHDRFWADDLIYTRSAGERITKADLMKGVRSAPPRKPDDAVTTYTAEEIKIQQYGKTAVVAFRLVGTTQKSGQVQISKFLNTGTFVKRNGRWQVVAWQATAMAAPKQPSE